MFETHCILKFNEVAEFTQLNCFRMHENVHVRVILQLTVTVCVYSKKGILVVLAAASCARNLIKLNTLSISAESRKSINYVCCLNLNKLKSERRST